MVKEPTQTEKQLRKEICDALNHLVGEKIDIELIKSDIERTLDNIFYKTYGTDYSDNVEIKVEKGTEEDVMSVEIKALNQMGAALIEHWEKEQGVKEVLSAILTEEEKLEMNFIW